MGKQRITRKRSFPETELEPTKLLLFKSTSKCARFKKWSWLSAKDLQAEVKASERSHLYPRLVTGLELRGLTWGQCWWVPLAEFCTLGATSRGCDSASRWSSAQVQSVDLLCPFLPFHAFCLSSLFCLRKDHSSICIFSSI